MSLARLGAISVTALMAGAGMAQAQNTCGASYEIRPGDTLYQVSQQCRVGLTRIMDLNPGIDPRRIQVGSEIALTASASGGSSDSGTGTSPERGGYRVNAGDTLYSIAQAMGLSLFELLRENEDIDPFDLAVGDVIDIPGGDTSAGFSISPSSGPAGDEVRVRASGLRPNDWVTIGVGRAASEWRALDQIRVAADGEVSTTAAVPVWAEAGQSLIYVLDTDRGLTLKSDPFTVKARGDTGDGDEGDDRLTLEGRVNEGVECTVLETRDGDVWSLVSDDVEFTPGEFVRVTGARADMSFCQQGVGTVDVARIEEVQAD